MCNKNWSENEQQTQIKLQSHKITTPIPNQKKNGKKKKKKI